MSLPTIIPFTYGVELNLHDAPLNEWLGSGLRFFLEDEATEYGIDLMHRWSAVRTFRVIPSSDRPNARFADGKLRPW